MACFVSSSLINCRDPVPAQDAESESTSAAVPGTSNPAPAMHIEYGLVQGASGSTRVRFGDTEAVCSVFGPRVDTSGQSTFSDTGRVQVDVKYCPFACPGSSISAAQPPSEAEITERLIEALKCTICLDKYPKCTVSVFVVIMQSGGNELSAALVASSLAMVDAAIEVTDIIAPCTVVVRGGVAQMNPTSVWQCAGAPDVSLTAAHSPGQDAFPLVYLKGRLETEKLTELLMVAKKGSEIVRMGISASLKEKVLSSEA